MTAKGGSNLFVLSRQGVSWRLFGIDPINSTCHVLSIEFQRIRNLSTEVNKFAYSLSEKSFVYSLENGRAEWKRMKSEDFLPVVAEDIENLPPYVLRRISAWKKFILRDQIDESKSRLEAIFTWEIPSGISENRQVGRIIPSHDYSARLETASDDSQWEYWDENGRECPDRKFDPELHGGDLDNYWNDDGLFESSTDYFS